LGSAVSGAGDVNGDGVGDFLVGAPHRDATATGAGRVYVYFGGSAPDTVPDLVIDGEAQADNLGYAVAPAGDVNGDGFGDFLTSARLHDGTGVDAGRAYVYFGGSTPNDQPDLVIDGESTGDLLGYAVAPAGDVNGDGFGDFLIGAPFHGGTGPNLGRAYLYLGGSTPDIQPDLVIEGDQAGAYLSGIDNFNGDGFSDFAVTVPADDVAGLDAGSVFILDGSASPDGQPDLTLRGPDGAVWYGGGGSVYLSDQGTLPTTPTWRSGPTDFNEGAALGDVDGDGDLDLVFSGARGSTVNDPARYTRYRNDVASIDATPVWSAPVPGESHDLELGDLDQDGDLDLVAVGFDGAAGFGDIFNNRNGGYAQQPDDVIPDLGTGSLQDVSLADFDGDGDVDMALAGPEAAALLRNDRQNWFSADSTWSTDDMAQTNGVALGDLDGDGDLDIVFANEGQQQAYLNEGGTVNRIPDWASPHSWGTTDVAVRDLDRDGFPEVVFATGYQQPFLVYDNPGVLATVPWESQDKPLTPAIDLGDVNLDGKPDLVGGNATFDFSCDIPSAPDAVYRGSSGRFDVKATWQSGPPYGQTHGVAVADLDGDLDPDLICANFCNESNTVRLNNEGTLSSGPDWTSPETATSWDVKVGDVDGDGLLDLVYARDTDMAVYQNLGGFGEFALSQTFGPYGARSIALGDVNADGRPDVVFGMWGRNGLYMNQGQPFDPVPIWNSSLSWDTESIALGDIDQDGDLDLVCGNNDSGNLGQKNTIYDGLRNPAYRGDPEHPTNQLPQNGVVLRGLTFQSTSLTTYRVRFELADVESDPVWIYPEYRIPPARVWSPMLFTGQTGKVGLLASSPQGTSHEFEWNTADVPLTLGDIDVRIRWTPIPRSSVGLVRRSGVYLYDLQTPPARPVIDIPQIIAFPTVTLGDTATVDLPVGNAGTDVMIVNDIRFSDGTMQTGHLRNFPVGAAKSESVPILLAPHTVGTAGKSLTVATSDPLHPEATVQVQVDVLPLDARVQVLTPTPAPLGKALTVLVSPLTHVESGDLVFRLDQAVGNLAAGQLDDPVDLAVYRLPQEYLPVLPAPVLQAQRSGEDEEDRVVLHEAGEDVERVLGEHTAVDLVLEQLVLVEEQDELAVGVLGEKRFDEPVEGARRVGSGQDVRRPLGVAPQLPGDLPRDLLQEVEFVLDGHRLHVDEDGNEVRSQASVQDLEEDGGLAAPPLAAEDEQTTLGLGVGETLANQIELGLAPEEHLPVPDRIPDDEGVGGYRGEGRFRSMVHAGALSGINARSATAPARKAPRGASGCRLPHGTTYGMDFAGFPGNPGPVSVPVPSGNRPLAAAPTSRPPRSRPRCAPGCPGCRGPRRWSP